MVDIFPSNTDIISLENRISNIVSIPYQMGEIPMMFKDTLIIPRVQYEQMTEAEINAIKISRYQTWLEIITEASKVVEING